MDYLFDESKDDKLIEDYLFSGYKPSSGKSGFEMDQQFAKSIQDEDLFGTDFVLETNQHQETLNNSPELPDDHDDEHQDQLDFEEHPFGEIGGELLNTKNIPNDDLFEESNEMIKVTSIDQVFEDDYSSSLPSPNPSNNENTIPKLGSEFCNYSKNSKNHSPSTPNLKEQLLQQAKSMGKPQFGTGFKDDGTIQVVMDSDQLVSDGNSKFIFNNLFNKSKKHSDRTPEKSKRSWNDLKNSLTKRICAEKRKVWDSFQQPIGEFDEEEEFVEPTPEDIADDPVATDVDKEASDGERQESEEDLEASQGGREESEDDIEVSDDDIEVSDDDNVESSDDNEEFQDEEEMESEDDNDEEKSSACLIESEAKEVTQIRRTKIIMDSDEDDL